MKIIEAIRGIDSLMHNTFTQSDKVAWLSELDWTVKREVIDTHEGGESINFTGYDDTTDTNTELLISAPYDKAYLLWLEAMIANYNGEYARYNNASDLFNTTYSRYKNYYNRTHMPQGSKLKYF